MQRWYLLLFLLCSCLYSSFPIAFHPSFIFWIFFTGLFSSRLFVGSVTVRGYLERLLAQRIRVTTAKGVDDDLGYLAVSLAIAMEEGGGSQVFVYFFFSLISLFPLFLFYFILFYLRKLSNVWNNGVK